MHATGLTSGTVYPALDRLESAGYLRSKWEADGGRARRRASGPALFHADRFGRDGAARRAREIQGPPAAAGFSPEEA